MWRLLAGHRHLRSGAGRHRRCGSIPHLLLLRLLMRLSRRTGRRPCSHGIGRRRHAAIGGIWLLRTCCEGVRFAGEISTSSIEYRRVMSYAHHLKESLALPAEAAADALGPGRMAAVEEDKDVGADHQGQAEEVAPLRRSCDAASNRLSEGGSGVTIEGAGVELDPMLGVLEALLSFVVVVVVVVRPTDTHSRCSPARTPPAAALSWHAQAQAQPGCGQTPRSDWLCPRSGLLPCSNAAVRSNTSIHRQGPRPVLIKHML